MMYLPPQFKADHHHQALQLIDENPFASLISVDDAGLPFVTHLPLHLDQSDAQPVLLGHCAKANPHWRFLQSRPQALVTFIGPHAYLSPSVYPDMTRVPTWNYLAVHCTVQATLIDDAVEKDKLLKKLITDHEPAYAQQWRSLGDGFAQKMLAGIVGFELLVTELQCKLKLNQHRPESHSAMETMYASGNENERALALWMRRLGIATARSEGND